MIEVTGLEAPRRIEIERRVGPFDARLTYELATTDSGTCPTNAAGLEPPVPVGFLSGLLAGVAAIAIVRGLPNRVISRTSSSGASNLARRPSAGAM